MRASVTVPAVAVAVVAIAAGGAAHARTAPARAAATKTVVLRDIAFSPNRVSIGRGGGVRFVWRDSGVPHDVTSRGRARFRSLAARTAGSAVVRFPRAGTYQYVCTIHFGMKGTVTVR